MMWRSRAKYALLLVSCMLGDYRGLNYVLHGVIAPLARDDIVGNAPAMYLW